MYILLQLHYTVYKKRKLSQNLKNIYYNLLINSIPLVYANE